MPCLLDPCPLLSGPGCCAKSWTRPGARQNLLQRALDVFHAYTEIPCFSGIVGPSPLNSKSRRLSSLTAVAAALGCVRPAGGRPAFSHLYRPLKGLCVLCSPPGLRRPHVFGLGPEAAAPSPCRCLWGPVSHSCRSCPGPRPPCSSQLQHKHRCGACSGVGGGGLPGGAVPCPLASPGMGACHAHRASVYVPLAGAAWSSTKGRSLHRSFLASD